nr:unnamed protein product [Digitaria exilis]
MSPVLVPLQQEEAVDRVDGQVVLEERDLGEDRGPRVEVEEASVAVEVRVAWVEAVALREHHPAPRVEARVDDAVAARGDRSASRCRRHGSGRSLADRRRRGGVTRGGELDRGEARPS